MYCRRGLRLQVRLFLLRIGRIFYYNHRAAQLCARIAKRGKAFPLGPGANVSYWSEVKLIIIEKSRLLRIFFLFIACFLSIAISTESRGNSPLNPENKAPTEGVKVFKPGPPPPDALPKEKPDHLRKKFPSGEGKGNIPTVNAPSQHEGGSKAKAPKKPKKVQNIKEAPMKMTVVASPVPQGEIPPIEKNLPANFYPHPPRTLPVAVASTETESGDGKTLPKHRKRSAHKSQN